ncbi:MAG: mdlC [Rhodospirillales bacterium]|nr:mdlC [Rhodospirillales bacterium]
MVRIAGKHAFLELLRDEGVDYLFGNPGSTELALMDALAVEARPCFVLGLHEGIVMSMAHGYAASTGRLAAVNLHAAPGLGNVLGMLYNVKKAGAPVLVTAGQQDLSIALREPLLWDDLVTIARPFVKWSVEVTRFADLPRIVRRAVKVALTPPTGPVFLSIPGDILAGIGHLDLMASSRVAPAIRGDVGAIARAAILIAASKSPMIFAGDSVCQSRAHTALVHFAELVGAPVYLEAMADRAAFPTGHPLFAGTVPRLGPAVRAVVDRHDLIISIGGDLFTESLATGIDPIPPGKAIVHLDNDPWQLAKNYPTDEAILADPGATLPELTAAVSARLSPEQRTRAGQRAAEIETANAARRSALFARAAELANADPIAPLALLKALGEILPGNAIVIDETLSSGANLTDLLTFNDEFSYFGLRGGGIGAGLPQAIGAKLGNPDRPVVALVGDGSAMFSFQALWTAAHERIPVTFVILNNRSYRILKQRTLALGDHSARTGTLVGMDLVDPTIDFVGMAASLGVEAVRVSTLDDFRAALAKAVGSSAPQLIDVEIDGRV